MEAEALKHIQVIHFIFIIEWKKTKTKTKTRIEQFRSVTNKMYPHCVQVGQAVHLGAPKYGALSHFDWQLISQQLHSPGASQIDMKINTQL